MRRGTPLAGPDGVDEGSGATLEELRKQLEEEPLRHAYPYPYPYPYP